MEQEQEQEQERFEDRNFQIYPVTVFEGIFEGIRSHATAYHYRRIISHFLDHIKISKNDVKVLLDTDTYSPTTIESLIIDYVKYLRDIKKRSHSTINVHCAAIFYFFEMNDVILNKRKIKRFLPPDESVPDDRSYTHEEIMQILSVCNLRSRVIFLLMASSGMRIGALHSLQMGDLQKQEKKNFNIYRIQVYARSKKDRYYTFCTPECAAVIDAYLDYRRRFGENLVPKAPLIREQFNKQDPFTINVPKFLSESSINHIVDDILNRSGIKTSETMRSHAFRKGFKSICEQSGMKSINVELLMGHNIGVSGHYYRPAESDILEDYLKAVDALTIDPTQRLQRENQELKDDLKGFEHLRDEIDELKHWVLQTNDPKRILQRLNGQVVDHLCSGESTSSIK